ncbi:VIT1/CCC1 transporter family protein [Streptomyces katsurahamanus]|uniref:VIT family protein n=1 Tax=Streptomyces katsurahamanus TaxID=2577098 RepID=A0ABW9P4E5_9ACTN|nr:VIT family protein [Streptomyces katsurahamanus]MQS40089.1 VIT family protein [Streptomyces katsurahamanus]
MTASSDEPPAEDRAGPPPGPPAENRAEDRAENRTEGRAEDRAEPHGAALGTRLNWLRAAVLGANDGIVSTAGLVVGVAGATGDRTALLTAGLAGLLAGSMSMAAGEYVSVSTQRDSERAAIALERRELREQPDAELDELTGLLADRGLSREVAREAAVQLTERDALRAHARVELGIDPDALAEPWHAAVASFLAFTAGALLPLLAIVLPSASARLPVTVCSVLSALVLTGWWSARLGAARAGRAMLRNAGGGALAMAVTYGAGSLLGAVAL